MEAGQSLGRLVAHPRAECGRDPATLGKSAGLPPRGPWAATILDLHISLPPLAHSNLYPSAIMNRDCDSPLWESQSPRVVLGTPACREGLGTPSCGQTSAPDHGVFTSISSGRDWTPWKNTDSQTGAGNA